MSTEKMREELKSWENTFKEIHGRKPSKSDIDIAPGKIRGLYKEYSLSKKAVSSSTSATNPSSSTTSSFRLKRSEFTFNKPLLYPIKTNPKSVKSEASTSTINKQSTADELEPMLCGVNPKFCGDQDRSTKKADKDDEETAGIGRKQFVAYFHSLSSFEMAVKRQNMCNLALIDPESGKAIDLDMDDDEGDVDDDPDEDGEGEEDGQLAPMDAESIAESENLIATGLKKAKRKSAASRNNTNYLRLDMKHKRYQAKALKRMKGAALKRFLFRQRMRKHRNA